MQKISLFYALKSFLIPSNPAFVVAACFFAFAGETLAQELPSSPIDVSREGKDRTLEGEKHFRNLQQLTFGGDNAEAYWSFDSKRLVFQSNFRDWKVECDQIFMFDVLRQGNRPRMVSTGKGRTTCAYFMPGDSTFLYASTHLAGENVPPHPNRVKTASICGPSTRVMTFLWPQNRVKLCADSPILRVMMRKAPFRLMARKWYSPASAMATWTCMS